MTFLGKKPGKAQQRGVLSALQDDHAVHLCMLIPDAVNDTVARAQTVPAVGQVSDTLKHVPAVLRSHRFVLASGG